MDKQITQLTAYTPPIDTDVIPIVDVTTPQTKKITWANIKAALKAYFDPFYGMREGEMRNGRILPSVTSNNLTVALKTLAGTDPSATDPVYVMINGVVRTITGALSIVNPGAYNYFNLASAELATKEVDMFAYLGWSTVSNSVSICISRIPNANLISDFNASADNEKYGGYYFNVNNNTTDVVVNIGRFAVIMSAAGAWSVPTFTASNLIQKSIERTKRLTCEPTLTWTGGTAPSGSPTKQSSYEIVGDKLFFNIVYYGYTAGSGNTILYIDMPFASGAGIQILTGQIAIAGDTPNPVYLYLSGNRIIMNFASLAVTGFSVTGFYFI